MSAPQSNKRHASGAHENESIKKRGRPSRSELASTIPEDAINRVQARRMLRRHPPVRSSGDEDSFDYDDLVSWRVEEHWDVDDDAAVDQQWDQLELKDSSRDMNSPQYASLFLLFKISLRLFKITPNTLVSPLFALRYQAVSKNNFSNEWIMSKTFCDRLMSLMVHPCWEDDIYLLALALKWTVICRLDSRRKWLSGYQNSCPALQSLFDEAEGYKGKRLPIPYHEMHEQARDRASREGESPSEFSDLLYQVGEAVYRDKTVRPKVEPEYEAVWGFLALPLTVWDLRVLSKVVDSMNFRPEWNYSVEDALKGWKAENSGHELPTQDKLSLVYEFSQKNVFRHMRIRKRKAPTDAGNDEEQRPDSSPFNDENESEQGIIFSPPKIQRPGADGASDESRPVDDNNSDSPLILQRHSHDDDNDDDVDGTFDTGVWDNSEEFVPQTTHESDAFRSHGPTVSETLPRQPAASTIHASHQDRKILSEISDLKRENKELRESQKRHDELMITMQSQLESMQSELRELSQRNQAFNPPQNNQQSTILFNKPATESESILDAPDLWDRLSSEGVTVYEAYGGGWAGEGDLEVM
ncbi:uncharacterized protein BKA55DRAFT_698024 [Fusarium redolens]|uniref:Uncharacterized protein n=1 Tax=Fusarium redolens TaxID=48865 RepID=A0A9P9JKT4_FUSRE|nr:uncharacterized protein BKA55DRAFT_698024 [Fusarium redolens]KAH7210895.1 hypothetical protein BKA55DRAFT_698024 [Fusarium redolens]